MKCAILNRHLKVYLWIAKLGFPISISISCIPISSPFNTSSSKWNIERDMEFQHVMVSWRQKSEGEIKRLKANRLSVVYHSFALSSVQEWKETNVSSSKNEKHNSYHIAQGVLCFYCEEECYILREVEHDNPKIERQEIYYDMQAIYVILLHHVKSKIRFMSPKN